MMLKVIKRFIDLNDNNHVYNVGDEFPRQGKKVTEARISELLSSKNKQKKPLIEKVEEKVEEVVEEIKEEVKEVKKTSKKKSKK